MTRRIFTLAGLILQIVVPFLCSAQQTAVPAPAQSKPVSPSSTRIETETITLTDFGAIPSTINRPPGRFVLSIVNKTRSTSADLVIESTLLPGLQLQELAKTLGLSGLAKHKRSGGLFDQRPGIYVLKSAGTGKPSLTITLQ